MKIKLVFYFRFCTYFDFRYYFVSHKNKSLKYLDKLHFSLHCSILSKFRLTYNMQCMAALNLHIMYYVRCTDSLHTYLYSSNWIWYGMTLQCAFCTLPTKRLAHNNLLHLNMLRLACFMRETEHIAQDWTFIFCSVQCHFKNMLFHFG